MHVSLSSKVPFDKFRATSSYSKPFVVMWLTLA